MRRFSVSDHDWGTVWGMSAGNQAELNQVELIKHMLPKAAVAITVWKVSLTAASSGIPGTY